MSEEVKKEYTLDAIAKHNSADSCWLIIGNASNGTTDRHLNNDDDDTNKRVSVDRFHVVGCCCCCCCSNRESDPSLFLCSCCCCCVSRVVLGGCLAPGLVALLVYIVSFGFLLLLRLGCFDWHDGGLMMTMMMILNDEWFGLDGSCCMAWSSLLGMLGSGRWVDSAALGTGRNHVGVLVSRFSCTLLCIWHTWLLRMNFLDNPMESVRFHQTYRCHAPPLSMVSLSLVHVCVCVSVCTIRTITLFNRRS